MLAAQREGKGREGERGRERKRERTLLSFSPPPLPPKNTYTSDTIRERL